MYHSKTSSRSPHSLAEDGSELPPEVRCLFPRDREIASVVYRNGLLTAKDIDGYFGGQIQNATVRSALSRLVRKGILFQYKGGTQTAFIYGPALTEPFARELALRQFVCDFYDNNFDDFASDLSEFRTRPPSLDGLLASYDRAPPRELRHLAPRMADIASIVYRNSTSSVREVQISLPDSLSEACVRTLLNRLEAQGLVRKRPSVRHREMMYLPAVTIRQVRRIALKRFIHERFDGAAAEALSATLQMIRSKELNRVIPSE